MPETNYKGWPLPLPGEDPLGSIVTMMAGALGFSRATDAADAGIKVDAAKASGATVSTDNPMPFLINDNRNLYVHNGGDRLQMINEPEWAEDGYKDSTGVWYTIAKNSSRLLMTSSLPTRPWDRMVLAITSINANIGKGDEPVLGNGYLRVSMMGNKSLGQYRLDESLQQSALIFDVARVPANTPPAIQTRVYTGTDHSVQLYMGAGSNVHKLTAMAWPISMADSL